MKLEYKVELFTGVRPTSDLTIANYLGAIKPIIELQEKDVCPVVFVADLHAMTDKEPSLAKKFTREVVADYLALGIDPKKTTIFVQSDIGPQVLTLTSYLARIISVAELLRVPTLKDKLKNSKNPETANVMLLLYPVLMAADILIQKAEKVAVGEDQLAHIEVTRELARRFNKRYGDIFPLPKAYKVESSKIMALRGEEKMSKTSPESAIFLTDSPAIIRKKIKGAKTAFEKEMNESLKSHIMLAKGLSENKNDLEKIDKIIEAHMGGEKVMGEFKNMLRDIIERFLKKFQNKRKWVVADPDCISSILEKGAQFAKKNSNETLELAEKAMFGK